MRGDDWRKIFYENEKYIFHAISENPYLIEFLPLESPLYFKAALLAVKKNYHVLREIDETIWERDETIIEKYSKIEGTARLLEKEADPFAQALKRGGISEQCFCEPGRLSCDKDVRTLDAVVKCPWLVSYLTASYKRNLGFAINLLKKGGPLLLSAPTVLKDKEFIKALQQRLLSQDRNSGNFIDSDYLKYIPGTTPGYEKFVLALVLKDDDYYRYIDSNTRENPEFIYRAIEQDPYSVCLLLDTAKGVIPKFIQNLAKRSNASIPECMKEKLSNKESCAYRDYLFIAYSLTLTATTRTTIRTERDLILEIAKDTRINRGGAVFALFPAYKDDEEIAKSFCKINPTNFAYASKRLQNSFTFCQFTMHCSAYFNIKEIPATAENYWTLVRKAIDIPGVYCNLNDISQNETLSKIDGNYKDFILSVIENSGNIRPEDIHASLKKDKKVCEALLKKFPNCLYWVEAKFSEEECKTILEEWSQDLRLCKINAVLSKSKVQLFSNTGRDNNTSRSINASTLPPYADVKVTCTK